MLSHKSSKPGCCKLCKKLLAFSTQLAVEFDLRNFLCTAHTTSLSPRALAMPMELVSKQLALNGQLKPEARLVLAITEFAGTLDSKRREEFRSMQNTQDAQLSCRDIIKMTEEINREGARRHRSWRPHGTKVGGFLSRIQTFAAIGDVLVGGSQNLIATGVWSAVRLSLTVSQSR